MSHITLALQGLAAVEARNWDEAIAKLSQALHESTNPAWLVARSKALVGLKRFPEALDDAELAWLTAYERNRRPVLIEAHYRRAVAYYRMGQYANADCCCIYAMRLVKDSPAVETVDPKAKWTDAHGFWTATVQEALDEAKVDDFGDGIVASVRQLKPPRLKGSDGRLVSTLRVHILRKMESLPADDEARKVTVNLKPEQKKLANVKPTEGTQTKETATVTEETATVTEETATVTEETATVYEETAMATEDTATATEADVDPPAAAQAAPVVPSDAPLHLQEFQTSTIMYVSIFSKGVDKEKLQVEFLADAVHLDPVVWPNGEKKEFRLQLWGAIDASASEYTVTPSNVELRLAKKMPGKWPQIQRTEGEVTAKEGAPQPSTGAKKEKAKEADSTSTPSSDPKPSSSPPKAQASTSAPSYPSSSRSGPKDWDKIATEVGDDEEEGNVNMFFKKLYNKATPEQQRAMMKSFTESNGTSLSTDWNDVKARKVETVPPEGVEAKKWE